MIDFTKVVVDNEYPIENFELNDNSWLQFKGSNIIAEASASYKEVLRRKGEGYMTAASVSDFTRITKLMKEIEHKKLQCMGVAAIKRDSPRKANLRSYTPESVEFGQQADIELRSQPIQLPEARSKVVTQE